MAGTCQHLFYPREDLGYLLYLYIRSEPDLVSVPPELRLVQGPDLGVVLVCLGQIVGDVGSLLRTVRLLEEPDEKQAAQLPTLRGEAQPLQLEVLVHQVQ